VPYRDEDSKRHLKVMGDLGQIVPLVSFASGMGCETCGMGFAYTDRVCLDSPRQEWDIRNAKQIEECVRHSDVVYNLAGRDWETRYVTRSGAGVPMQGDR
jgi:NADH dehydrogenase (ubiquinone) 1 alpha subcomplex subunit 9